MKYINNITEWSKYQKPDVPRKGDYVLLRFPTSYGYDQIFFDNNIGQIIKKRSGHDYVVKFDKYCFDSNDVKFDTMDIVGSEIKYYNKNKEELKKYIDANKYNL